MLAAHLTEDMRDPPKLELPSRGRAPSSTGFLLGECSRNPSVSVYQLALLWEAVFSFSKLFWKTISMCLPVSWWVIYECTHPHLTEGSAVFDQKLYDPHASPFLFTQSLSKWLFLLLFPQMKKCSKGNVLPMCKRWNKKKAEALKGIKIENPKTILNSGTKHLNRCNASNGEYFEGDRSLNT